MRSLQKLAASFKTKLQINRFATDPKTQQLINCASKMLDIYAVWINLIERQKYKPISNMLDRSMFDRIQTVSQGPSTFHAWNEQYAAYWIKMFKDLAVSMGGLVMTECAFAGWYDKTTTKWNSIDAKENVFKMAQMLNNIKPDISAL